jgi:hypothetical protein
VNAAVGRQVSVNGDALSLECDHSHEIEEEGFASPVLTDDEAHRGTPVCDPVDVAHKRLDLTGAADLDMAQTYARDDTGR